MRAIFSLLALSLLLVNTVALANKNLSGVWYHDGRQTSIQANGFNRYFFCNENNNCTNGYIINGDITVPQWGVSGHLRKHGEMIEWTNGTRWSRYGQADSYINVNYISGKWYHNNATTYIRAESVNSFVIINENGEPHRGVIKNGSLYLPSLGIKGTIKRNGRMIVWSNQTVWVR